MMVLARMTIAKGSIGVWVFNELGKVGIKLLTGHLLYIY